MIVEQRANERKADEALLTQLAVASIHDKKAGGTFKTLLKVLRGAE